MGHGILHGFNSALSRDARSDASGNSYGPPTACANG